MKFYTVFAFLRNKSLINMMLIILLILLGAFTIIRLLYNSYKVKERNIVIKTQDIQEDINLIEEYLRHQEALAISYKIRMQRYDSLEKILEKLNTIVMIEDIVEYLAGEVFRLVAQSEGNVIIYLLNKNKQRLEILKTCRQAPDTIIKLKEGDIFDYWVLKQTKPLLVEDAKTDFRFDSERLDDEMRRSIRSLIASPMILEDNFIGILRVDRESDHPFSTEDLRILSTISDVAGIAIENAILYQRTNELAMIDSLTHLYHRKYFLERLERELLRAKNEAKTLSIVMLDIDYFKNYNDQFGHIAGDIVLKRVASVLRSFLDVNISLSCRFGGEEFLFYLTDSTKEDAIKTAELLRKKIEEEKIILRRQDTSVTVSIGMAFFPDGTTTSEDLIKLVDQRMYKAKSQGRNQICFT